MTIRYPGRKVLYCLMAICLLMGGLAPFPVVADDEYFIIGTITEAGSNDPIANNEISVTNLMTNETEYTVSNSSGCYQFNLDDLELGWIPGDKILLRPGYIDVAHEGYPVKLVLDDEYPFFTWTIHLLVAPVDSPIPPDPPYGLSVANLYVINRHTSNDDIVCNVPDGWHCDIPSNDYDYVRLLVGYFMYDDGYSDFPQPEAGDDYTFYYNFYFDVYKTSDNSKVGSASSGQLEYDTYYGDDPNQLDPFLTINIDDSNDEKSLWIWVGISINLYNKDTKSCEYSEGYAKAITGIRLDWPD